VALRQLTGNHAAAATQLPVGRGYRRQMTIPQQAPTVAVTASVEREVSPDSFVLTAQVSAVGADAATALHELVARYAELERVTGNLPRSVEARPGELRNWPQGGKRKGWWAERAMTLIGSDPSIVGEIANALAAVPEISLQGPTWQVDRDNPAYAELQADAVIEARARAQRYAAALGGTLGRLAELSDPEGSHLFHGPMSGLASNSARGTGSLDLGSLDLGPQSVTIRATVNATWYLVLTD
jgi:uncharacterized protein YggE